ncbi:hypothetical protein NNX28_17065 [Arthrobacter sp. zg-Y859]|uniref:Uncharacterized protein n=1 Tax=Arthrobacter jinronghuae TaxID=2964609 RepID=A0ABT1NVJ2_9MICC|nr:hypothetical protein [Arthrobacter jinronghuae]MCQ1951631.1 hypothetical protein [Arthrobacter jinronghuae]UWX79655.1 hypothetical protein N2K98_05515 [Arthrobacter jinronghuae]
MGYYAGREDFEKNLRHLMNEQTNLSTVAGRINTAGPAGLIASQGDINIVRREMAGLTAAVQALAGSQSADQVGQAIRDAVEATAPTYYVKSEKDATVYALDVATGKLRPVTLDEWNVVNAAGISLRVVPQKFIDAAPKATAAQPHPAPEES